MGLSRPEYCSEWPFPSPGDLPNPGSKPRSPTLQADSLPDEPQGKPKIGPLGWVGIKTGSTAWKAAMLTPIPPANLLTVL